MSVYNSLYLLQEKQELHDGDVPTYTESADVDIVNEAMDAVINNLKMFKHNMIRYYKNSYCDNIIDKSTDEFLINLNKKFIENYLSQVENIMLGFENNVNKYMSRNSQLINKIKLHEHKLNNMNQVITYNGYKYTTDKPLKLELYKHIKTIISDITNDRSKDKEKFETMAKIMKTNYFDTVRGECIGSQTPIKPTDFNSQLMKYFRNGSGNIEKISLTDDQIGMIIKRVLDIRSISKSLKADVNKLRAECEITLNTIHKVDKIKATNQLAYLTGNDVADNDDNTDYKDKILKVKYTQLVNICGIYLYAIGLKSQMIINSLKQDMYILEHLIEYIE